MVGKVKSKLNKIYVINNKLYIDKFYNNKNHYWLVQYNVLSELISA